MAPMSRRHHYEQAFEHHLRANRIPYVSVDDARKALLPAMESGVGGVNRSSGGTSVGGDDGGERRGVGGVGGGGGEGGEGGALKSFDFVIYGQGVNLLADVKGRKVAPGRTARLECWVTQEDVESLTTWERLFGEGFEAAFVFVYWCAEQPPDALFQEVFTHADRWYALRAVTLARYRTAMRVRSRRWRTVDLPARAFAALSQPFSVPALDPQAPVELSALHPHGASVGSAS
jgi:phage terminase large subunit-like protein